MKNRAVTIEEAGASDAPVVTGYTPRDIQFDLHQKLRRFNVILAHRRLGKTVFALNHLIHLAVKSTKPMPRFAFLSPTYGQARRTAWDYLKQFTDKIPGVSYNEADLRCDFSHNGARIMLLSSENPMSLKGIYLDYVVLDEFGDQTPVAWREVVRPTLSDRKGGAIFIGTVKGQNHFWEMYQYAISGTDPDWYGAMFKASETRIIDQGELDSAKRQMTEEEYNQEFECDPLAGLVGAYFSKELAKATKEGRVTRVPHDPMLPVDLYFDLGINDMAAAWFIQSQRGRHRVIDHFEASGLSIPEFVAELRKRGPHYNFGEWVLPHDAQARDFSTGKTQLQVFYSLGCRPARVIPRVGTKRESINAARMIFGACEFDEEKCKQGLKALSNYQRKWDAKNNVFQESPLHNWASNSADAFQQFALGVRENSGDSLGTGGRFYDGKVPLQAETDYDPYA